MAVAKWIIQENGRTMALKRRTQMLFGIVTFKLLVFLALEEALRRGDLA